VDRSRKILDTAAAAFYEKGFHGVGVDELGKRAGLSGPAIYRHFSGKDELLATLLNEAMDELTRATVPVHNDPARDLERALVHHLTFATRNRHLINLYQREVRSLVDPWARAFDERRIQYTERWEQLFSHRFPTMEASTVAAITQATLGMVFSISYWPGRTLRDVDSPTIILQMLSNGLVSFDDPGSSA
jgi:AcrR family transcriptional regulator